MKKYIDIIKQNWKLLGITLLIGLALGWLVIPSSNETSNADQEHAGHEHEAEESTVWTCSMHPQIKQDKFGLCPICAMDLIPLVEDNGEGDDVDPNEISMSASAIKLAEVQTQVVWKGTATKKLYLQGKIHIDERKISELTARFGGRIEALYVNFTGQKVNKGQKLARIYSPELLTAQKELLEALKVKDEYPNMYKSARTKLELWDLNNKQIQEIENTSEAKAYFDILSPITGTVRMRHVALGDYVKQGMPLFKLVNLSKLWVLFDAYESDLAWIKLGDKANFSLNSLSGKKYEGKVSYIDPFIDAKTRVSKVRVEVDNKEGMLKPEMFVNGEIESQIAKENQYITVPQSAVLWTGKRSVVYVKVPDRETTNFLYREVELGPKAGDRYVILSGLKEGEEIAVNGVFKIDAAAQLLGKTSMMNPGGGTVSTGHNHGDMGTHAEHAQAGSFDKLRTGHNMIPVAGNCEMCKERIEKAAKSVPGVNQASWDVDTKQLHVNYDEGRTDINKIQKAIAATGHDTEAHKAEDSVYESLHSCCKYDRMGDQKEIASATHASVKVAGNCGMCKDRIEKAAKSVSGVLKANWDKESKLLHVDFDASKTNLDAIQKNIAKSGHDTEAYKADDSVYETLPGCCKFDRMAPTASKKEMKHEHASVRVAGNCGMCKDRIEEAAKSVAGVSSANWDKKTLQLHVDFDASACSLDDIQKAVAKAGHDTEKYKTADDVYENLHGCCKYERF